MTRKEMRNAAAAWLGVIDPEWGTPDLDLATEIGLRAYAAGRAEGIREGRESMREEAAQVIDRTLVSLYADAIRAIPLGPGEKP